jgi:hypothetical protein
VRVFSLFEWYDYNKTRCRRSNEGEFDLATSFPLLDTATSEFNQNSFSSGGAVSHPLSHEARKANEDKFHQLPLKEVTTVSLKAVWQHKDRVQALKLLNQKHVITLDKCHQLRQPGSATYTVPSHCLDFLLLVPRQPGLDVLRPPAGRHHLPNWTFDFDMGRPSKQLSVKRGMLGFAPEGSALYCGRVGLEMVFMCLVDEETFNTAIPSVPAGSTSKGPTNMARRNLRICQTWLMSGLSKAGIAGIWCEPDQYYSVSLTDADADWGFTINFRCVIIVCVSASIN